MENPRRGCRNVEELLGGNLPSCLPSLLEQRRSYNAQHIKCLNGCGPATLPGASKVTPGPAPASVSVKEFFQRVTDPWSLTFVRQRENCESQ